MIAALAIVIGSLFVTTYTLALGDPVARRIDAALVGDPRGDAGTVKAVQGVAENSLDFTHYESLAAARDAIDRQRVYAALDLTSARPTLYVASAAGASVARVLEKISAVDPSVRVVDTHPLASTDPSGLDIFYLMLVATIIGFITVFQTRALAGGLPLRRWTGFVVAFALAASLALTLVEGPILDRLDIPVLEVWGILAMHLLAVASFASANGRFGRPVGDRPDLAVLRGAGQQLVGWRGVAAAAAGAVRVRLAVASVGGHRHLASRRDLLPRLPARAADPRLGGLGGSALRSDAGRLVSPRDQPRRPLRAAEPIGMAAAD